jgi:hypothetical protein
MKPRSRDGYKGLKSGLQRDIKRLQQLLALDAPEVIIWYCAWTMVCRMFKSDFRAALYCLRWEVRYTLYSAWTDTRIFYHKKLRHKSDSEIESIVFDVDFCDEDDVLDEEIII